jgi:hypothetical protein
MSRVIYPYMQSTVTTRNILCFVGFKVLTAASMNMTVFWIVEQYSLVEV